MPTTPEPPPTIIVGGGIAGLATALALGERGRRVQVLERSAPPPYGPPGAAGEGWDRPTVPQARHSHTLTSLGVAVLRGRAPGLWADLLAAGAVPLDLLDALPPGVADRTREPGDDELAALACRRTTLELLLYRRVERLASVRIEHGVTVRGITLDAAGQRRVTGVVTADGRTLDADCVVDATGRRAAARGWLADSGAEPPAPDLQSPSGFRGYSRFYRLTRPGGLPGPLNRGNAAGLVGDHYAAVVHPADDRTFSVVVAVLPGDDATRHLRYEAAFTAVARATPAVAPWVAPDVAGPITGVRAIPCPPNALRAAATDPTVAGLHPVGDAACVTNPLYGRGMSFALAHAYALADLLIGHPVVDAAQARAAAGIASDLFTPWYRQAEAADAARIAQWRAATEGAVPAAAPDPNGRPPLAEIAAASTVDGTVWRGLTRYLMGLTPPELVFDDDKFRARVREAATRLAEAPPPARPPVPDRAEFLRLIASAVGRDAASQVEAV